MQVGPLQEGPTNQGQCKDGCSAHNEGWVGNLAEQFVFFLGAILFCSFFALVVLLVGRGAPVCLSVRWGQELV